MDRTTWVRTGVASAVAGLGIAVGGVALATADDAATQERTAQEGGRFGHRLGHGAMAAELADKLGLDEDKVADVLEKVHEALRPERPDLSDGQVPEPPTDEEIEARQAALAKALAKELDVSEAKVAKALDELRADVEERMDDLRADLRDGLVDRLAAAVEDGTLTEADKASVLKAYDAGLIGGMRGGPGFGPGFGHRFGGGDGGGPTT